MNRRRITSKGIKPAVLSIAGSDCSGMAGIQMDLRTMNAMGVHGCTVISANTAQNNDGVQSVNPVSRQVFSDQLNAVLPLQARVIKMGVLCSTEQIDLVVGFLGKCNQSAVIIDPVLKSTSGSDLVSEEGLSWQLITKLVPHCDLITPNIEEAEILTGLSIETAEQVELAAEALKELGAENVLIKGGHATNKQLSQDFFLGSTNELKDSQHRFWLSSKRVQTDNTRGTGCAMSSAIASAIAVGYGIEDAVVIGKMAINQGLRNSYALDKEAIETRKDSLKNTPKKGPVDIRSFPSKQLDLPVLSESADVDINVEPFLPCVSEVKDDRDREYNECREYKAHRGTKNTSERLGLYPVVDSAEWLARLIPQGIKICQLRVKSLVGETLEKEIISAINIARKYNCRLFINDYWQLAIKHGAYGVHLGQEDLDTADINAIKAAGLHLGLSTHCHYEVARAHRYRPSYIACGPIYHTKIKQMPWIPQGLEGLNYWQNCLDYPLVAIGGINDERLSEVAATDVESIALITAITLADGPEKKTQELINRIEQSINL